MSNETKPPLTLDACQTDYEYARFLLDDHMLDIKTCGNRWYVYEDGIWKEDTRHRHRPTVLKALKEKHRTAKKERAVLDLIEGLQQTPEAEFRGAYYKEGDTIFFNLQNGVLKVTADAIELLAHDKATHFTRAFSVDYKPKAKCPTYEKTLLEALPDEADRTLLQLCFGNFLLPDCRFETVLVCYGESGCSKSTIADPVAAIFGNDDDGLITSLSLAQICDPKNYSTTKLRYASVNLGTELQGLEIADSGIYKQIVSGEKFEARPIYGEPFKMQTPCKLWFLTNNLPQFRNGTEAEQRRMRFIRFDQKPAVNDVNLKNKLALEHSGIFNFMLVGLQRLMRLEAMPQGGDASQHVMTRFGLANDPIGSFVTMHCRMHPDAKIEKSQLTQAYAVFAESNNYPTKINDSFFRRLYARFPSVDETRLRTGPNDLRTRFVTGLELKPESDLLDQASHLTQVVPPVAHP